MRVTVVYLSRATAWEAALPEEVRRQVVPTQRGAEQDMSLLRTVSPAPLPVRTIVAGTLRRMQPICQQ